MELDPRSGKVRLAITVSKANNLRAADFSFRGPGTSDPYVTIWVKDRPLTELKSDVIPGNCDPVWDFHGVIERCKVGDAIEFQIWDHDRVGSDDLLGRVSLEFDDFYPSGYDGTLHLEETGKTKKPSTVDVKVEVLPTHDPEPDEDAARCYVTVESARDLRSADFGGKSDPYCYVRAHGKKGFWRTKVIEKTINPDWNEEDEVPDFELGDDLEFVVYDWDRVSDDDELGRLILEAHEFTPDGFRGTLPLRRKGTITIAVDLVLPPPPKPIDPGDVVGPDDRKPAPFQLRCMDTGRLHRLAEYTMVGRSNKYLDERFDLVLASPGNEDVARHEHAIIKCFPTADPANWRARIYNFQVGRGAGFGSGGGHNAGGTSVDNVAVYQEQGVEIEPGSVIRFGVREMWVVERAGLYQKSRIGEGAIHRARVNATEEVGSMRELRVPSGACNHALQHCSDWDSLVRVVLEWCGDPDEPPCVDAIEVMDECDMLCGRYEARTLEEQEAFNMKSILKEVRMGCTIRLRLSSDPYLLAPILRKLQDHQQKMKEIHNSRNEELFGGFSGG